MIKFGTSGWRGIIARDFTFDNVRLATQGLS
jgi:phosphomannomutase